MNGRLLLWLASALLYGAFFWWYTNTSGPLSDDEIDTFVEQMRSAGRDPEQIAELRRFMAQDDGRQFLMVNVLHMADTPKPVPGVPADESADAVLSRYMAHMYPELAKRASHPVFAGSAIFATMDVTGIEGAEKWTSAALMRYRSRRDLLEIAMNPVFREKHVFKMAALEKTIAFPVRPQLFFSDARLLLFLALLAAVALVDAVLRRR